MRRDMLSLLPSERRDQASPVGRVWSVEQVVADEALYVYLRHASTICEQLIRPCEWLATHSTGEADRKRQKQTAEPGGSSPDTDTPPALLEPHEEASKLHTAEDPEAAAAPAAAAAGGGGREAKEEFFAGWDKNAAVLEGANYSRVNEYFCKMLAESNIAPLLLPTMSTNAGGSMYPGMSPLLCGASGGSPEQRRSSAVEARHSDTGSVILSCSQCCRNGRPSRAFVLVPHKRHASCRSHASSSSSDSSDSSDVSRGESAYFEHGGITNEDLSAHRTSPLSSRRKRHLIHKRNRFKAAQLPMFTCSALCRHLRQPSHPREETPDDAAGLCSRHLCLSLNPDTPHRRAGSASAQFLTQIGDCGYVYASTDVLLVKKEGAQASLATAAKGKSHFTSLNIGSSSTAMESSVVAVVDLCKDVTNCDSDLCLSPSAPDIASPPCPHMSSYGATPPLRFDPHADSCSVLSARVRKRRKRQCSLSGLAARHLSHGTCSPHTSASVPFLPTPPSYWNTVPGSPEGLCVWYPSVGTIGPQILRGRPPYPYFTHYYDSDLSTYSPTVSGVVPLTSKRQQSRASERYPFSRSPHPTAGCGLCAAKDCKKAAVAACKHSAHLQHPTLGRWVMRKAPSDIHDDDDDDMTKPTRPTFGFAKKQKKQLNENSNCDETGSSSSSSEDSAADQKEKRHQKAEEEDGSPLRKACLSQGAYDRLFVKCVVMSLVANKSMPIYTTDLVNDCVVRTELQVTNKGVAVICHEQMSLQEFKRHLRERKTKSANTIRVPAYIKALKESWLSGASPGVSSAATVVGAPGGSSGAAEPRHGSSPLRKNSSSATLPFHVAPTITADDSPASFTLPSSPRKVPVSTSASSAVLTPLPSPNSASPLPLRTDDVAHMTTPIAKKRLGKKKSKQAVPSGSAMLED